MNYDAFTGPLEQLRDCALCPRMCHVNRFRAGRGVCKSDASFNIASVCIHHGEEPPVSGSTGICNIFFAGCNLRCIYCQNFQISDPSASHAAHRMALHDVISAITRILDQGINRVGFVSPSHDIPQMQVIINIIQSLGYHPVWVYNSNGYDKVETLRALEGVIDVYLPDFKYMERELALNYSGVADYPKVAMAALKEMMRQKGAVLHLAADDTVASGIIVRHLVLPGHIENSLRVVRFLAEDLSARIHVSLMAQYYPVERVAAHPKLGSCITESEYRQVINEMEKVGLGNGWKQEFESRDFYRPDFNKPHPFA